MSRAKTEEEIRKEFLDHVELLAEYWANLPDKTNKERCEGVAFSIMTLIDGCSSMPAIDLSVRPHDEDKKYHIENSENYYEKNMVFNDCMLHEMIFKENK